MIQKAVKIFQSKKKDKFIDEFSNIFKPKLQIPKQLDKFLRILVWNVQGLKSHEAVRNLELLMRSNFIDIAMICETGYFDDEPIPFKIDGYTVAAREDKKEGIGKAGGTLIYVSSDLFPNSRLIPIDCDIPLMQCCAIELNNLKYFSYYRSPNQNNEDSIRSKNFLLENLGKNVFHAGDWNIPKTNWEDIMPEKRWQKQLVMKIQESDHEQLVTVPTRLDPDEILDIVITDRVDLVDEVDVDYSECGSDHKPVLVKIKTNKSRNEFQMVPDKNRINWDDVRKELESIDFNSHLKHERLHYYRQQKSHSSIWGTSERVCICGKKKCKLHLQCKCGKADCDVETEVNERAELIKDVLNALITKHTPIVKRYVLPHNKGFISSRTQKQRNYVKKLRKQKMFQKLEEAKILLRKYQSNDIQKELLFLESHLQKKKNLYKSMKEIKKGVKSSTGIYVDYPNSKEVTYDPQRKVDILNTFYGKMLQISDPFDENWDGYESNSGEPVISKKTILSAIKSMNSSRAIGPDGLSANDIKQLGPVILQPLKDLYTLCYEYSVLPELFKISKITPIPKGGCPLIPKQQRPLNINASLYKPFEIIIVKFVYLHLELDGFFSPLQFGFRMRKSCSTQLIKWTDTLQHNNMVFGGQIVTMYDFVRAFDLASFSGIVNEMRKAKLDIRIVKLAQNWFTNKSQYVHINGYSSSRIKTTSSCGQGASAGPCFFLVLVNSVFKAITKKIENIPGALACAFADDIKVTIPVVETDTAKQVAMVQDVVDVISEWSDENKLLLSETKGKRLNYGKVPKAIKDTNFYVTIAGQRYVLQNSNEEKDLGVIYQSPNISFDNHIQRIVDRCSITIKNAKHILRRLKFKDLLNLWTLYIKSIGMYCGLAWFRLLKKDQEKLNLVYKRFWSFHSGTIDYEKTPLTIFQELIVETIMFHYNEAKLRPCDRLLTTNPMDPFNNKVNLIPTPNLKIEPYRPKRKYVKFTITPKKPPKRKNNLSLSTSSSSSENGDYVNEVMTQRQQPSTFDGLNRKTYFNSPVSGKCQNSLRHRLFQLYVDLPYDVKKYRPKRFKNYIINEVLPQISPECENLRQQLSSGELHLSKMRHAFYQKYHRLQNDGVEMFSLQELQDMTQSSSDDRNALFEILKSDPVLVNDIISKNKLVKRTSFKNGIDQ